MGLALAKASFGWQSAGITHQGVVRPYNEDNLVQCDADGVFAVADGMGGHAKGDVASETIVSLIGAANFGDDLDSRREAVTNAIQAANRLLVAKAAEQGVGLIGSTVVSLALAGSKALIHWAGDSRLYRLRGDAFEQLSVDHSQVQDLVNQGFLTPEEAEKHPSANVVTRAVGAAERVEIDEKIVDLADNDTFLICSDGLNKTLPDAEIADLLKRGSVRDCAESLLNTALERQARDNVTLIVVRIEERTAGFL